MHDGCAPAHRRVPNATGPCADIPSHGRTSRQARRPLASVALRLTLPRDGGATRRGHVAAAFAWQQARRRRQPAPLLCFDGAARLPVLGWSPSRPLVVRICAARLRQALDLLGLGLAAVAAGGACARLTVWVRCARTPSRISVHDRAVRPAGDMMVDGVIPLGGALRPLGRWRPSTRTWRQDDAGSRPRCIGVSEGCARKTDFTRVAVPRRRARAGCGSCA